MQSLNLLPAPEEKPQIGESIQHEEIRIPAVHMADLVKDKNDDLPF
jgi:hypothetical protein